MPLDQHDLDADGKHDADDCELCVECDYTVKSECRCGNCCETLLIEASLRDGEREPRIAQECRPIYDDQLGQGPKEIVGYLLNDLNGDDVACRFFDRQTRLCTIHETRPLVCRLFDCDGAGREQLEELGRIFDERR